MMKVHPSEQVNVNLLAPATAEGKIKVSYAASRSSSKMTMGD